MYDRCVYVDNLQIKGIKSKIYQVVLWNKEKIFNKITKWKEGGFSTKELKLN